MWDLGIKAQVPLPKKWQNYSHIAQFIAFFSDSSKKKLEKQLEVYVRTYLNRCGSDYYRTSDHDSKNYEGQYIIYFSSNHKDR